MNVIFPVSLSLIVAWKCPAHSPWLTNSEWLPVCWTGCAQSLKHLIAHIPFRCDSPHSTCYRALIGTTAGKYKRDENKLPWMTPIWRHGCVKRCVWCCVVWLLLFWVQKAHRGYLTWSSQLISSQNWAFTCFLFSFGCSFTWSTGGQFCRYFGGYKCTTDTKRFKMFSCDIHNLVISEWV